MIDARSASYRREQMNLEWQIGNVRATSIVETEVLIPYTADTV